MKLLYNGKIFYNGKSYFITEKNTLKYYFIQCVAVHIVKIVIWLSDIGPCSRAAILSRIQRLTRFLEEV